MRRKSINLKRAYYGLICLFIVLLGTLYAADSNESLARVSIRNFSDQTNSKNYQYLSESIPEAIEKSMKDKFEFNSMNRKNNEALEKNFEKDLSQFDLPTFKKFAQKTNSDIIIFGRYTYDATAREIMFQPVIYIAQGDKLVTVATRSNKVDSTIFQATELIADDIVAEITRMANESQKNKTDSQVEAEKPVLTRDLGYTVEKYSYTSLGLVVPVNAKPTSPGTPISVGSDLSGLARLNNMYTLRLQYKRLTISPFFQPYLVGEIGYSGPFVSNVSGNIFTFRVGASVPIKLSNKLYLLPSLEGGLNAGSTTFNFQNAPVNTYSSIKYTMAGTIIAGQFGFLYHMFSRVAFEGGVRYDYRKYISVPSVTHATGTVTSPTSVPPIAMTVSDSQFGIYFMCSFLFRN